MAPELQADDNDIDDDEVEGSTNVDLQVLSTRIALPDSIVSLDFVLANDLFIQTKSIERAIKTLKQLIIPRKSVRFAPQVLNSNSTTPSPSSSPSQTSEAKSQRKQTRFKPYTENTRKSNRIAARRQSAIWFRFKVHSIRVHIDTEALTLTLTLRLTHKKANGTNRNNQDYKQLFFAPHPIYLFD